MAFPTFVHGRSSRVRESVKAKRRCPCRQGWGFRVFVVVVWFLGVDIGLVAVWMVRCEEIVTGEETRLEELQRGHSRQSTGPE